MALRPRRPGLAGCVLCLVFATAGAEVERDPPALTGQPQGVRPAVSPPWSSDPRDPGFELPESGRSLFDHLIATMPDGRVPFPLTEFATAVEARLQPHRYFDSPVVRLLVPRGRSLQREAASPRYSHYPRAILAIDAEPRSAGDDGGMLLRHRLYVGYMEVADVLEVISYNEDDARFEFQLVRDYSSDGAREVVYANRTLCTACHQNAAPIFARPLWDETNANPAVAAALASEKREYYGFPVGVGVDAAYAFDNATDHANLYSTLQRIWVEACGEDGDDCRATLLLAVLRYGLSGERGVYQGDGFETTFLPGFAATWHDAFPKGLAIPNPNVPNRTPDAGATGPVPVTGSLDALRLRAPLETWHLDEDTDVVATKVVPGLAAFLAVPDFAALDEALDEVPSGQVASGRCVIRPRPGGPGRLRLSCEGDLEVSARLTRDGDTVSGGVSRLAFDGEVFLDLGLAGKVSGTDVQRTIELALTTIATNRRPRKLNGDGLERLSIDWDDTQAPQSATLRLDGGGERLKQAVAALRDRTERGETDALADRPFRRAAVMAALETALDRPRRTWCCLGDDTLAPLRPDHYVETVDEVGTTGVTDVSLSLFFSYCGSCHRSGDAFPPNFLAGDIEEAERRLGHCSERVFYRLSMWQSAPGSSPRSPMPPHAFIYRAGLDPAEWIENEQYRQLLDWVDRRVVSERGGGFRSEQLLSQDYRTLRTCLPDDAAGERVATRHR